MWPGKAKPAPSISACLLIGLVQSASAAPPRTSSTPRAMIAIDGGGVRRVGAARHRRAGQRVGDHREAVGRGGLRRGVDHPHRHAEGVAEPAHVVGVADQEEAEAAARARSRP